MRTVAQKMGIKEQSKSYFKNAPEEVLEGMQLPAIERLKNLNGDFDYIHFFAKNQQEQRNAFQNLKEHLSLEGMLWVSWPKNKQMNTDLTLHEVIKIGYEFGLVESTCLSINDTWSGLKFTHPKKGKNYNNSHAELKSRTTNR